MTPYIVCAGANGRCVIEVSTRLNDPRTGAIVLVQQRIHDRDLTSYLLEAGGWEASPWVQADRGRAMDCDRHGAGGGCCGAGCAILYSGRSNDTVNDK